MLLCCAGAHAEGLLAQPSEALPRLLESCTVGLLRGEIDALLLLEGTERLPIAALQEVRQRLLIGEVLLIREVGLCDARTVATESPSPNRIAGESIALLSILLSLRSHRLLHHVAEERRHIGLQCCAAELLRAYSLRACERIPEAAAKESLPRAEALLDPLLRLRERWQECAGKVLIAGIGFAAELLAGLNALLHERIRGTEASLTLLLSGQKLIRGCPKIRLSGLCILTGLLDALLLGLCKRSDESFGCRSVLLEGAACHIFRASIDGVVPRKNLGRDRYLLGGCL